LLTIHLAPFVHVLNILEILIAKFKYKILAVTSLHVLNIFKI